MTIEMGSLSRSRIRPIVAPTRQPAQACRASKDTRGKPQVHDALILLPNCIVLIAVQWTISQGRLQTFFSLGLISRVMKIDSASEFAIASATEFFYSSASLSTRTATSIASLHLPVRLR